MAELHILCSKTLNSIFCLLLLATTLATSARILDDVSPQLPIPVGAPDTSDPITPPETEVATIPDPTSPSSEPEPVISPPLTTTVPPTTTTSVPPIPAAATTTTTGGIVPEDDHHPTLSFFMHDILGGSNPSGRAVTGIVANSNTNNLPFSKPNNQIFPINGGVPLNTINGAINNNNAPFLVGLNGSPTNGKNNNNNNQAFVTSGQLPTGLTLQQLMFGSVTVVDNELTEGHELGTGVIGRAQGFYLTSSSDGSSHTVMLTALFHGPDHDEILDTVSFFGVHRTATPVSHIAIVGGTGKYEEAKGYATIETLPHEDQHTTDGLETITHFTLYLTP
ncbi:hypothetical protein CASFOL_006447 [Castilleja foliolosa]|uniref:Dirigent protein n=1 Tax=Castilleja foliolosa TaxID=1961234 RepID=A0ABD3EAF6_9LAMI